MTLGKDVSALFPDVLKNIATSDLDQKKLVYLYLMLVILDSKAQLALIWTGITRNHTPIFAFSQSIPSYKTPKILTL